MPQLRNFLGLQKHRLGVSLSGHAFNRWGVANFHRACHSQYAHRYRCCLCRLVWFVCWRLHCLPNLQSATDARTQSAPALLIRWYLKFPLLLVVMWTAAGPMRPSTSAALSAHDAINLFLQRAVVFLWNIAVGFLVPVDRLSEHDLLFGS
jgi:hypothetical protein